MKSDYDPIYQTVAMDAHWQPWLLLKAMAEALTRQNPHHYRCERADLAWWEKQGDLPEWRGHKLAGQSDVIAGRYGILSLPYTAALQMGYPWDSGPDGLYNPGTCTRYALAWFRSLGMNVSVALAAYQSANGRAHPGGAGGRFANQRFVDQVWRIMWRLEHPAA